MMLSHPHRVLMTAAAASLGAALTTAALADDPTFTSSWKAPEASGISFKGKKVASLVMTTDQNLQISVEEQIAKQLDARGMMGVATYRMVPKEVLTSSDAARPWFERAKVEGVVALRPVSADTRANYSPPVWAQTSYGTLWGYYGYGWSGVYIPRNVREDTTLVVETLIFSVPLNKLLWGGVSTTTNPKKAPLFIKELADATVKELKHQQLIK